MNIKYFSAISTLLVLTIVLLAGCGEKTVAGAAETRTPSEQREVVFLVPDMSCPMCPITVRKALGGVAGVLEADASLEDKWARVVFDPARTDIDALIAAVAEAGFTATPRAEDNE